MKKSIASFSLSFLLYGCATFSQVVLPDTWSTDSDESYNRWNSRKFNEYRFTFNTVGNFSSGRSKRIFVKNDSVTVAKYNRDSDFGYDDKYYQVKKGQKVKSFEHTPTIDMLFEMISKCHADTACIVTTERYHKIFGHPIYLSFGSPTLEDGDSAFGVRDFEYRN